METLLFFDIDGTLLPALHSDIPESTRDALVRAKKAGCQIFINTGRTRKNIPAVIESLEPDGYICGCGTAIYYHGEQLFHRVPSPARCRQLVLALRRHNLPCLFESDDAVYFDAQSLTRFDFRIAACRKKFAAIARDFPSPLSHDLSFEKFFVFGQPFRREKVLRRLAEPDFQVILREHQSAEVTLADCSKGTGIHQIAAHLQVSLQNCYAFGDSANDIDMPKAVPHSVAMGNSAREVLPLCEYVTDDILRDGIRNALLHYQLI